MFTLPTEAIPSSFLRLRPKTLFRTLRPQVAFFFNVVENRFNNVPEEMRAPYFPYCFPHPYVLFAHQRHLQNGKNYKGAENLTYSLFVDVFSSGMAALSHGGAFIRKASLLAPTMGARNPTGVSSVEQNHCLSFHIWMRNTGDMLESPVGTARLQRHHHSPIHSFFLFFFIIIQKLAQVKQLTHILLSSPNIISSRHLYACLLYAIPNSDDEMRCSPQHEVIQQVPVVTGIQSVI